MASGIINIVGKVTKVSEVDAKRLSAFIILCERVLASVPIQADSVTTTSSMTSRSLRPERARTWKE